MSIFSNRRELRLMMALAVGAAAGLFVFGRSAIAAAHTITEFTVPTANSTPFYIAARMPSGVGGTGSPVADR
jgi:hypothetical protein